MDSGNWFRKPKYDCLLFDLDDTLYPLNSGLSDKITKNIIEYMKTDLGIVEEVPEMCDKLYQDYGTTMAGLKALGYDFAHGDYNSFVHGRLPYDEILKPDPVLKSLLQSLPIRKVIFTNGDEEHVARVLGRLGLEGCFERVICLETLNPINKTDIPNDDNGADLKWSKLSTDFIEKFSEVNQELRKTPVICKPFTVSFEEAFKIADINPERTLFFDDSIRNLQTGKNMGLHTVWVGSSHRTEGVDYALKSIHNMREALPELWEAFETVEEVHYTGDIAIETPVGA